MKAIKTIKKITEDLTKFSLFCSSYGFDKTALEITKITNELFGVIEQLEELQESEPKSCDGCEYYIELVKGKPETIVCSIDFDCIRKYKPKDRYKTKG